jgi:hypothetical protein
MRAVLLTGIDRSPTSTSGQGSAPAGISARNRSTRGIRRRDGLQARAAASVADSRSKIRPIIRFIC